MDAELWGNEWVKYPSNDEKELWNQLRRSRLLNDNSAQIKLVTSLYKKNKNKRSLALHLYAKQAILREDWKEAGSTKEDQRNPKMVASRRENGGTMHLKTLNQQKSKVGLYKGDRKNKINSKNKKARLIEDKSHVRAGERTLKDKHRPQYESSPEKWRGDGEAFNTDINCTRGNQ